MIFKKKSRKEKKKKKRKKRYKKNKHDKKRKKEKRFEHSGLYDFLVYLKFLIQIIYFPIQLIFFFLRLINLKQLISSLDSIKDYIKGSKYTFIIAFLLIITTFFGFFIYNYNTSIYENHLVNSIENFQSGRFHSLVTSIFIHGSIYHMISNILALIFFGRMVERRLKSKFILIFFLSGIFSNLLRIFITSSDVGSIGASGAIAALIPIAVISNPMSITFFFPMPITTMGFAILWVINEFAALSLSNNIANDVHIFGFSLGFIFGLIFIRNAFYKLLVGIIANLILGVILYYLGISFL